MHIMTKLCPYFSISGFLSVFRKGMTCQWLCIFVGLFLVSDLLAQKTGSTRLTGRIQDGYTGKFMASAAVMITETGRSALTDSYGGFRIGQLSEGIYTVEIKHAGYGPRLIQVELPSGKMTELGTIQLRSLSARAKPDEVYELDAIRISPETDAYSIALQEQRMSDMNKVVVNSGTFENVTEGNIGEFVKFLPGVSVNYVAADIRSIEVRGMGANFTPVTVDGNRMASAASTEPNRNFELEQVSINNVERIEVIRVPTADISADALGGSVNLVSKSAFERDGRHFSYRAYLNMNDEALDFGKSPGWGPRNQLKVWPGFDFNYSDIFADGKLGINLNYLNSNQFNPQYRSRFRWSTNEYVDFVEEGVAPADGSDPALVLWRYENTDGPKFTHRESVSLKADYKVSEDLMVSASFQWNDYNAEFRNRTAAWDTAISQRGVNTEPHAVVSETEVWSRTYNPVQLNSGVLFQTSGWADKFGDTKHSEVSFVKTTDNWIIDGGVFHSLADNQYRALDHGFMGGVTVSELAPGNMVFRNFGDARGNYQEDRPDIDFRDANGSLGVADLGFGNVGEFALLDVADRPQDGEDEFSGLYANAKWNLDLGGKQAYLKFGARFQGQDRFGDQQRFRAAYLGPDGVGLPNLRNFGNFDDQYLSVLGPQLIDEVYVGQDAHFVGGDDGVNIQWPNNEGVAELYKANPDHFIEGQFAEENILSEANDIFTVEEDTTAAYIMGKINFSQYRMSLTAGLRFEETDIAANGALFDFAAGYQRDSTGSPMLDIDDVDRDGRTNEFIPIVTDPANPRREDAIETFRLQWLSSRQTNRTQYDDIYPSLGLKVDLTDQLLLRLGYAKTIGRPNFSDIIPRTELYYEPSLAVNESTGSRDLYGSVKVNNTGLRPYEANNWDLSLEYYPESGGQWMLGLFRKDITNWITDINALVTQEIIDGKGLPEDTLGFAFQSTANAGSAKVEGLELSLYRPLNMRFLPEWSHKFSVLANGTFLSTSGDFGNIGITEPITDLENMVKNTINFGLSYENNRFKLQLNYNKRGKEFISRNVSRYRNVYNLPLEQVDLSAEYRLSPTLRLFANGRNITKSRHQVLWESYDYPSAPELEWEILERSSYFGVQWIAGIKGNF